MLSEVGILTWVQWKLKSIVLVCVIFSLSPSVSSFCHVIVSLSLSFSVSSFCHVIVTLSLSPSVSSFCHVIVSLSLPFCALFLSCDCLSLSVTVIFMS